MSFGTAMDEFAKVCNILNYLEKFAYSTATVNYHTIEKACIKSLDGFRIQSKTDALRALRPAIAGLLTPETVRQVLTPYARSVVEEIGLYDRGFALNMVQIRDYMAANTRYVKSRVPTIGAYNAFGSGTVIRLTLDQNGVVQECGPAEGHNFKCIQDKDTGTPEHQEKFSYQGATKGEDAIEDTGSGETEDAFQMVDEVSQKNLLFNPSFTQFNGTAPTAGTPVVAPTTTAWPGWVVDTAANFKSSADHTSRDRRQQTNQKSVLAVGNGYLRQYLNGDLAPKKIQFKENTPYIYAVRLYTESAMTGNINFTLGSITVGPFTIASLTNATLLIRHSLSGGEISGVYYKNFKTDNLYFQITLDTVALNGDNGLFIDDCELVEAKQYRGIHRHIAGGDTADTINTLYTETATTFSSTRGIVQYWACYRTRLYELLGFAFTLPWKADGSETVTDVQ